MYLDSVSIKNFRLFESLSLNLNRGMNILVGENDSGKTAFIDAIRLTLGTSTSEKHYPQPSDFHKESKEFLISLKFKDLEKFGHIFLEHLTHEISSTDTRTAVLYVNLKATLTDAERRGYPIIKTEIRSGEDGSGPLIDSELRTFLATTYLKPLRDAESELSSGRGSRLSQILASSRALKDPKKSDEILKAIASANTTLVAEGSPISETSNTIREKYLHKLIFESDKEVLKAIIDIAGLKSIEGLTEGEKRKYLRTVLESLRLTLSNTHLSHGLGYHNLLFMAAELLLLEQELDSESPLLLIEEPEAHLHPQLQLKLLDFLSERVQKKDKPDGLQVILTTHSPNLSSRSNPEHLILMHKGRAHSLRSEETKLESDDYVFLQKFLDATKANLFFARGVILVEGDSENILMPAIARILGVPLEDYGVSVINIGNTGWKRFAKIFLKRKDGDESVPTRVAVMRDLDLWPNCAEENESNPYGFKIKKPKNEKYWLSNIGNVDQHKLSMKDGLEAQNVKVFISDQWTFEYCLAHFGLFEDCVNAIHGFTLGVDRKLKEPRVKLDSINGDQENKSTYVLSKIEKEKTDFAINLVKIIEEKFEGRAQDLIKNLPPYLIGAISYATGKNLSSSENPENVV